MKDDLLETVKQIKNKKVNCCFTSMMACQNSGVLMHGRAMID